MVLKGIGFSRSVSRADQRGFSRWGAAILKNPADNVIESAKPRLQGPTDPAVQVRIQKKREDAFELDVAFTIAQGITIIFGASGAGKTTLLDCIAGLTTPEWGHIAVGGRVLFDSDRGINLPVQNRRIGYVFQDLALFPHLSVKANVVYGLSGIHGQECEQRTRPSTRSAFSHYEIGVPRSCQAENGRGSR